MPELPEVLTTINYLKPKVVFQTISQIWFDKKTKIDNQTSGSFSKQIIGSQIVKINNIGKYIIFYLSDELLLIIHQKISGHLLLGSFYLKNSSWTCSDKNIYQDPNNRFVRIVFTLSNGLSIALSDPRRLSRITLIPKSKLNNIASIKNIGINPFSKEFSLDSFRKKLLRHPSITIKQALLNQTIVAGIGNIYADEILFKNLILPTKKVASLKDLQIKSLHQNIHKILSQALKNKGTTFSNYRNPDGKIGQNKKELLVYHRKDLPCVKCKSKIHSIKINNRSSYFCNKCQK